MKNILKVVFVLLAGFIGAGFASGQEIYLFFFKYGYFGIISLIISCFLMSLILYKSLKIISKKEIDTYSDFLNEIFNSKKKSENKKNSAISFIFNVIINIFMVISFLVMVAGFGAYFNQELGINKILGSAILSFFCFIVFMTDVKGLLKVSEIIVPILIILMLIIGVINVINVNFSNKINFVNQENIAICIVKGVLYCSYNIILLLPILITIKKLIKNKKSIISISVIFGIIILLLALLVFFLLQKIEINISTIEMPAVYVVGKNYSFFKKIYGLIIIGSIFTTAISVGMSFLQNISKSKKSYTLFALILCITGAIISNFGFSNLVELLYPVFGILGLLEIFYLFFNPLS